MAQIMLIRLHEVRAKYDAWGALQWKPLGGKTWYSMAYSAMKPINMRDQFYGEWEPKMDRYKVAVKIRGKWDRRNKMMEIFEFLGVVG